MLKSECPSSRTIAPLRGRLAVAGLALAALAISSGCHPAPVPVAPPANLFYLEIAGRTLRIEVANESRSREKGMMFRTSMPENDGMLFIYPEPKLMSFWMANTHVPLSIAFLDDSGKILQIEDMKPLDRTSVPSKHRVRYALEMNQGWFQRAGVAVGDVFPEFSEKVAPFLRAAR